MIAQIFRRPFLYHASRIFFLTQCFSNFFQFSLFAHSVVAISNFWPDFSRYGCWASCTKDPTRIKDLNVGYFPSSYPFIICPKSFRCRLFTDDLFCAFSKTIFLYGVAYLVMCVCSLWEDCPLIACS